MAKFWSSKKKNGKIDYCIKPMMGKYSDYNSCFDSGVKYPLRFCLISHLSPIINQGVVCSGLVVAADFMECIFRKPFKASFKFCEGDVGYLDSREIVRRLFKFGLHSDSKYQSFELLYSRTGNKVFRNVLMKNFQQEAKNNHRISRYFKLQTIDDIKHTIYCEKSIILATFPIYNYEKEFFKPTKEMGEVLGYHMTSIVGFDNSENYFLVRNSWGVEWGYSGYTKYYYKDFGCHISLYGGVR
jgi:hypothetical protein